MFDLRDVIVLLTNATNDKEREEFCNQIINALPPALPPTEWIPCEKLNPDRSGEYWVTKEDEEGAYTDIAHWNATYGRWESIFKKRGFYPIINNVIAWMPHEPRQNDTK